MKSSPSSFSTISAAHFRLLPRRLSVITASVVLFFALFLTSAAAAPLYAPDSKNVSRNHHHPCSHQNSVSESNAAQLRALCLQLHRHKIHVHQPPPPPAPPGPSSKLPHGGDDHEIDPRYGVEKRLVPSGPNPLHN